MDNSTIASTNLTTTSSAFPLLNLTSTMVYTTLSTVITTSQPTTNQTYDNNTNQTYNNNTNQTNTGMPYCSEPVNDAEKVLLIMSYIVIFVLAVAGNGVIIYVVMCYRNIKTAFNLLIVNMAIADIVDALVAVPSNIAILLVGFEYPGGLLGKILCKLQSFLQSVSISASLFTLTIIAIDRYFAIVHVLRKPMGVRCVLRAICCTWLVSGIMFTYELYRMRIFPFSKGKFTCGVVWGADPETEDILHKTDTMVKLLFHYVLPLIVMIVVYTIILLHLWQRKAPGELNDNHQKRLERQKRKIIKMLVTIVTAFAICWLPVHVNHFMIGFYYEFFRCSMSMGVIMLFYMVAHANAAINPCLYLIFNQNFRDGLKHIFNKGTWSLLHSGRTWIWMSNQSLALHRRDTTIIERTSTTRDVISNATAIPNIGYQPSTPQLVRLNQSSSGDEMADSRL